VELKKSLKILKNNFLKNEEICNTLYHNYPHLIHLSEKQLCIYFDVTTIVALKHIKKQIAIDKTSIQNICNCLDSKQQNKDLYSSLNSAKKQVKLSQIKLTIYPCPDTRGWHLSKV
jgi:hypothetical protein